MSSRSAAWCSTMGKIGLDVNQQTITADQIVATALSATGTNIIIINLLGTPGLPGRPTSRSS